MTHAMLPSCIKYLPQHFTLRYKGLEFSPLGGRKHEDLIIPTRHRSKRLVCQFEWSLEPKFDLRESKKFKLRFNDIRPNVSSLSPMFCSI